MNEQMVRDVAEDVPGCLGEVDSSHNRNGYVIHFGFTNGYVASVINHDGSYGTELALMHGGEVVYDVPEFLEGGVPHLGPLSLYTELCNVASLPKREV